GISRSATVVVQNMGATAASAATIAFTPFGGGVSRSFSLGSIAPGASKVFDLRYALGDTTQAFCSSAAITGCLGDGDFSFVAASPGANLAAVVNVISNATAMGYVATPAPTTRSFMPNVTRTLGGSTGWTTPLVIQSATATTVALSWYRFSDGALITTTTLNMTPGSAQRVDPRNIAALSDDTQ